MAKRRWYSVGACKEGGYISTMGYLATSAMRAWRLHAVDHPGWDVVEARRATNKELRLNLPGYEMTETFYGR